MSINSISDIYSRIYTSQINKTNSTDETEAAANSSGTTSLADILELGSSEDDLSAYLNYDASGNYSSLPTLVDYLSSDSDENDLLSNLQSNTNSLTDVLYSDSSENSTSGIFDSLIAAKSKEIDNLISNALEKLGGIEADTTSDNNE